MNIAFFDFDHTLTTKDSFWVFIKYVFRKKKVLFFMNTLQAIPFFILWRAGLLSNNKAKQKVFASYFKHMEQAAFIKECLNFSTEIIPNIINEKAFSTLREHQQNGEQVCVVSASFSAYLSPWCSQYNIDLLATEVQFADGTLTGEFQTPNCTGFEKEKRIKAAYQLNKFDLIYAYGDSNGDKEMLALATNPHYRHF